MGWHVSALASLIAINSRPRRPNHAFVTHHLDALFSAALADAGAAQISRQVSAARCTLYFAVMMAKDRLQ